MKTYTSNDYADRVGRWFGMALRGLVRQDARAMRWMVNHGMPRQVAVSFLWIVKLCVIAALLYAAFWLALVIAVVLIVAAAAQPVDEDAEQPKWLEKDPDDHREDPFYHPLPYTDEPDTRYYDPRRQDRSSQ